MKNAHFTNKNARAVAQLRSWFGAVGIDAVSGNDIAAKTVTGEQVEIRVLNNGESHGPGLSIAASVVTGRKISEAFDAFAVIQKKLGYEPKLPVNRGAVPTHKAHFSDDFESVAFRHTELHRAPNPTKATFELYDRVIHKAIWSFMRTNYDMCVAHGLEHSDLKTYAMVWTTNFLGSGMAVPTDKDSGKENAKLLCAHLFQRFGNFRDILQKKQRNVFCERNTAEIVFKEAFGDDSEGFNESGGSGRRSWRRMGISVSQPEVSASDEGVSTVSKNVKLRRDTSAKLLETSLLKLGHDRMIELLSEAGENALIHPDASKEARRRLRAHKEGCVTCANHLVVAPAEEEEDAVGVDEGGGEE